MSKKRKPIVTNPLPQWLLEYVNEHDVSLTVLSTRAGLSAGSLRSLVKFPERLPTLETCMKLAEVTGKPPEEIFQMAGLDGATPTMALNPDRLALVRIYDSLPAQLRQGLMQVARSIQHRPRASSRWRYRACCRLRFRLDRSGICDLLIGHLDLSALVEPLAMLGIGKLSRAGILRHTPRLKDYCRHYRAQADAAACWLPPIEAFPRYQQFLIIPEPSGTAPIAEVG